MHTPRRCQHHLQHQRCRRLLAAAHAALPPGVEPTGSAQGALLEGLQGAIHHHAALYALELLLVGAAAYAAAVWPTRPRGWAFKELIAVRALQCPAGPASHRPGSML